MVRIAALAADVALASAQVWLTLLWCCYAAEQQPAAVQQHTVLNLPAVTVVVAAVAFVVIAASILSSATSCISWQRGLHSDCTAMRQQCSVAEPAPDA